MSQVIPLPEACPAAEGQSWHGYDAETKRWTALDLMTAKTKNTPQPTAATVAVAVAATTTTTTDSTGTTPPLTSPTSALEAESTSTPTTTTPAATKHLSNEEPLVLTTWNVDAFGELPQSRIRALITHIRERQPSSHIIFLQEVSRQALQCILQTKWIQDGWYSSERDETNWGIQSFATMMLMSRERFVHVGPESDEVPRDRVSLGPIWRIKFKSRFMRDALCADIFVPWASPATTTPDTEDGADSKDAAAAAAAPDDDDLGFEPPSGTKALRLINVHLDSLAIEPSYRPQQLELCASLLRCVGRGVIAGDFNPVLPEDAELLDENDLVDAWETLRPGEAGHTWGIHLTTSRFPPGRLDKVALWAVKPKEIETVEAGTTKIERTRRRRSVSDDADDGASETDGAEVEVEVVDTRLRWSDHSGLRCSFSVE